MPATWPGWLNRLTGGLGLIAAGLVLFGLSAPLNADLVALQTARPCQKDETTAAGCYRWLPGRVTAIGTMRQEDEFGASWTEVSITLDLPDERKMARVNGDRLPLQRPRVGDPVDVRLWREEITDIRFRGVTVSTSTHPVVQFLYPLYGAGLICLVGLALLLGYVVDRRAGYV